MTLRCIWTGLHSHCLSDLPPDAIGTQQQWDQEVRSITFDKYLYDSGWGRYRGAPPGVDEWYIHPLLSEPIQ